MKRIFTTLLALVTSVSIISQVELAGKISGGLMEASDGNSLENLTIGVYSKADSLIIRSIVSDGIGSIVLDKLPYGSIFLSLSFVGYKKNILDITKEIVCTFPAGQG